MRTRTLAVVLATLLALVTAAPAHAASYRKTDVEKALKTAFARIAHGGAATATCRATARDTRWTCRLKRPAVRASSRFRVTVRARGRWTTGSFSFPGFTARQSLSGCCLRRR